MTPAPLVKPVHWNDPPNLAVIDHAIELVRSEVMPFTCCALSGAAADMDWGPALSMWEINERRRLYTNQYRKCIWGPEDKRPEWWNSIRPYKRERIAALKKFRKACIDAAKKGTR